jgi:hypothetical protein
MTVRDKTASPLGTILLVEDQKTDAQLIMRALQTVGVLNPITHLLNADKALA